MYLTGKIKLIIILCTSLLTCHNLTADDQIKESLISDNHANYSKEEAQTSDEPNLDVILNHYVEAIEKKRGSTAHIVMIYPKCFIVWGKGSNQIIVLMKQ